VDNKNLIYFNIKLVLLILIFNILIFFHNHFAPVPRTGDIIEIRWQFGLGKDNARVKKVELIRNEEYEEDYYNQMILMNNYYKQFQIQQEKKRRRIKKKSR